MTSAALSTWVSSRAGERKRQRQTLNNDRTGRAEDSTCQRKGTRGHSGGRKPLTRRGLNARFVKDAGASNGI